MTELMKSFLFNSGTNIIHNNPLNMSDTQIMGEIYSTHVHSDTKFDAESLFNIAANILRRSTYIFENVVQGNQGGLEPLDNTHPPAGFTPPLCILKKINSEMSCKAPGEKIAYETTLAILKKLSNYSWVAKGVLTLSAFAIEYGEFWNLSQHLPTQPLVKSLAIMKRVPQLTKPEALKKYCNDILELNNLITATWQVIEIIIELERLATYNDIKKVPALALALEEFPVDVFWVINTIVAIVTQFECITTDSNSRQNLSQFRLKISIIINKLTNHVTECTTAIAEEKYITELIHLFQTPTEVMEVFKVLIFRNDDPKESIYDGSTKTLVNIEVLKKKDVFLFISTLDISQEDISMFITIYDHLKKTGSQYKIVWIPVVDEWTDKLKKKFDSLKSKMPWYVLHHFAPIKGIKFIKQEWHFHQKPLFVVLSPQAKILHHNAFHMIQVWGVKGFPYTEDRENSITQELMWVDSLLVDIDIKIKWEEKYFIIYGGKDKAWIQEFTKFATALANDTNLKQANTSIELLSLESQQTNVVNKFWSKVESLFLTKMNNNDTTESVKQQVEKLLSYKNETGWAIVTKGSVVTYVGHGTTASKTVVEFDKWKEVAIKKGFGHAFNEHHDKKVAPFFHLCSRLEIHKVDGKIPDFVECPDCRRRMEVFITYKCCHDEDKTY